MGSQAEKRVASVASHLSGSAPVDPATVAGVHAPTSAVPPAGTNWNVVLGQVQERASLSRKLPENDPGIVRQRKQEKLTVRERVALLLDEGSFREHGSVAGSATYGTDDPEKLVGFQRANFVAGKGKIQGRPVVVGADDFSVRGGHADGAIARKAIFTESLARELRVPMIRLVDGSSGGGSVAVITKSGYSKLTSMPGFNQSVKMLDEIPVAAACLGPAVGLGAAKAATAHFVVMPQNGQLFAAGPPVVLPATHENLSKAQLGGPNIHGPNGTVDNIVADEREALLHIRRFLSYLPTNRWTMPPLAPPRDPEPNQDPYAILKVIPENGSKPYDPMDYLRLLADEGSIFEIGIQWGREVRTVLARFGGKPCYVFAGDPRFSGGALGAKACEKLCRAIGIASTFTLPIINFVDCPGFAVGTAAERSGTIRAGARLTAVSYDSKVPWYCVVARKAYGVGGGILVARGEGDDPQINVRVAWPSGEWGSLPLAGGVEAAFKGQLEAIKDPGERERERVRIARHLQVISNPVRSAEAFDVEEIVSPLDTRALILDWLETVWETRLPALVTENASRQRGRGASIYIP
ncbi:propionyl-CoA carboxylase [Hyaloraphidium curvatum]|nr:propionyl-CoA carboxylase [Hyaloraphidium curvatum]